MCVYSTLSACFCTCVSSIMTLIVMTLFKMVPCGRLSSVYLYHLPKVIICCYEGVIFAWLQLQKTFGHCKQHMSHRFSQVLLKQLISLSKLLIYVFFLFYISLWNDIQWNPDVKLKRPVWNYRLQRERLIICGCVRILKCCYATLNLCGVWISIINHYIFVGFK